MNPSAPASQAAREACGRWFLANRSVEAAPNDPAALVGRAASVLALDRPWEAAKGKKGKGKNGKATKAAAKAGAKRKRSTDDAPPRHRSGGKPKLASWLKARPNGCGKCRYIPGCTKSCYLVRGEKVPK